MNELTINREQLTEIEIKSAQALEPVLREYVIPRQEPMLGYYDKPQLTKICLDVLTVASVDNTPAGQPSGDVLAEQTILLMGELTGRYLTMTAAELKIAFKRGIRGEFGDFYGLCPKTYALFIRKYFNEPKRQKAWLDYLDLIDKQTKSNVPIYMTKEYYIKSSKQAYLDFLERDVLPSISWVVYDTIKNLLGLKSLIEPNDYDDIYKFALIEYKNDIKSMPQDIVSKWSINPKEWTTPENTNSVFERKIKKIALKYYFNKLKAKGQKQLIENV